ncbi:hypothetical protein GOBAR_DD19154 [Gossypium barbadense]|nr:hypothetical protein GOBAR_DD19154 [Gossypium barbadense]
MTPIWKPPQEPFVKVNFDAAFKVTLHHSYFDFVIRNSRGSVMDSGTVLNKFVSDPFTAEAIACLQALNLSREMGGRGNSSYYCKQCIIREMRKLRNKIPAQVKTMTPIWKPHQEPFVKVNFDVACKETRYHSYSGFFIRNSRGSIMGSGIVLNKFVSDWLVSRP